MTAATLETDIVALIEQQGPSTGTEIRTALGAEQALEQWRTCMVSSRLTHRRVGRRYLRLDEEVEGYARFSPSILREFLTYTVVGLVADVHTLEQRAANLASSVSEISAAKLRLAKRVVDEVVAKARDGRTGDDAFAVLLAGDIVYEMAHDAPRPERSTGQMVRGSDLDLVVILDDSAPEWLEQQLDDAIYQQKYRYLINPSLREEIDYTIKRTTRVLEQVEFATFKDMVPCKILEEAVLLAGNPRLFRWVKDLLHERGIPRRLLELEQQAATDRQATEDRLLLGDHETISQADRSVFCGTEEMEEFD